MTGTRSEMAEPRAIAKDTLARLREVSAATVTMQLIKRGIRRSWIHGTAPLDARHGRIVGEAYTMRFVPAREDVATRASYAAEGSIRDAIEAMPEGRVVVVDARGEQGAATLGDILIGRIKAKGGVAVVSDGPMRDVAGVRALDFPVFCTGAAAPPSIAALHFVGFQEPIGCGGAAVFPGDVIVADEDGAVVIPRALADEVAAEAPEQERFERYALERIAAGAPVKGLYPPDAATLAAYEAWLKKGGE